jgi:hypothetical protein
MLATADDTVANLGQNNSSGFPVAWFLNTTNNPLAQVFLAEGSGSCEILVNGDLSCTGTKSAVVPVEDGQKMVALYAVEAPENWFEVSALASLRMAPPPWRWSQCTHKPSI